MSTVSEAIEVKDMRLIKVGALNVEFRALILKIRFI